MAKCPVFWFHSSTRQKQQTQGHPPSPSKVSKRWLTLRVLTNLNRDNLIYPYCIYFFENVHTGLMIQLVYYSMHLNAFLFDSLLTHNDSFILVDRMRG